MLKKKLEEQAPGTIKTFYYGEPSIAIPVISIKGRSSGQTLLITAGIHGSEYPGIEAAIRLKQRIKPEELSGNLIILPCVNQSAFFERSVFVHPIDRKNLNRCFPGNRNGTESEQLAYVLEKDFFPTADFYLDFHSGDLPEQLDKFVFIPGIGEAEVKKAARKAAEYLDLPFGVLSESRNGAYNHACLLGLPSLLIERGGCGERAESAINGFLEDAYQVLRYLKILNDQKVFPSKLALLKDIHYLTSVYDGLWTPAFSVGDTVNQGEIVGVIEDFFANVVKEYTATKDGKIIYQLVGLPVSQGEILVAYGC